MNLDCGVNKFTSLIKLGNFGFSNSFNKAEKN